MESSIHQIYPHYFSFHHYFIAIPKIFDTIIQHIHPYCYLIKHLIENHYFTTISFIGYYTYLVNLILHPMPPNIITLIVLIFFITPRDLYLINYCFLTIIIISTTIFKLNPTIRENNDFYLENQG